MSVILVLTKQLLSSYVVQLIYFPAHSKHEVHSMELTSDKGKPDACPDCNPHNGSRIRTADYVVSKISNHKRSSSTSTHA